MYVLISIDDGRLDDVQLFDELSKAVEARSKLLKEFNMTEEDVSDTAHSRDCYFTEDDDKEVHLHTVDVSSEFFTITRVHRDDVKEALKLTDEKAKQITDEDMKNIARCMEDDYVEQLFHGHLRDIAEVVLEV